MIQGSNSIRGNWRLGKVKESYPSNDGKVRRVTIKYKNLGSDKSQIYDGKNYTFIERPVHKLIVIVPIDEEPEDSWTYGDGVHISRSREGDILP